MSNIFNRFRRDEDGAVTVDWVVLTAVIVVFGSLVGGVVVAGAETGAQNISDEVADLNF